MGHKICTNLFTNTEEIPSYLCLKRHQHATPDKFSLDEIPKLSMLLRLGRNYGGAGGDVETGQ